jgi:hypothetical protein
MTCGRSIYELLASALTRPIRKNSVPFGAAWSKNLARNLLITAALFLIYLLIVIFLIPLITHALA